MKMPSLALVAALAGGVGLTSPANAKGENHKTAAHVYLINDGREIRIDPIPNRIPSYSGFGVQLEELDVAKVTRVRHYAGRPARSIVSLAQNRLPSGRNKANRLVRTKRTSKISRKPVLAALNWGDIF